MAAEPLPAAHDWPAAVELAGDLVLTRVGQWGQAPYCAVFAEVVAEPQRSVDVLEAVLVGLDRFVHAVADREGVPVEELLDEFTGAISAFRFPQEAL